MTRNTGKSKANKAGAVAAHAGTTNAAAEEAKQLQPFYVRFVDGNKLNCQRANLVLVTELQLTRHPEWTTDFDLGEPMYR
jgi:hypothetical protein